MKLLIGDIPVQKDTNIQTYVQTGNAQGYIVASRQQITGKIVCFFFNSVDSFSVQNFLPLLFSVAVHV